MTGEIFSTISKTLIDFLLIDVRLCLIIARLAYVYGEYTSKFAAHFLVLARVHQRLDEEMKWLWTKDLKVNTVQIKDVTRALWAMADWYAVQNKPRWDEAIMGKTPIFNVVDKGDTTQGKIAELVGKIFKIKTGFQGATISSFARLNMGRVVDDLNEKFLDLWATLLKDAEIVRPTPLTPFLEMELLKDKNLSMDGSRLEEILQFEYSHPKITEQLLQSIIDSYVRMGWWPM